MLKTHPQLLPDEIFDSVTSSESRHHRSTNQRWFSQVTHNCGGFNMWASPHISHAQIFVDYSRKSPVCELGLMTEMIRDCHLRRDKFFQFRALVSEDVFFLFRNRDVSMASFPPWKHRLVENILERFAAEYFLWISVISFGKENLPVLTVLTTNTPVLAKCWFFAVNIISSWYPTFKDIVSPLRSYFIVVHVQ